VYSQKERINNLKPYTMKRSLLFAVAIFFCFSLSFAQSLVNKKQVNQRQRISQGISSGELTRHEATQLKQQQIHINQTKKRAASDGVVTKKERAVIHQKQQNANKNIYVKKHNGRDR